MPITPPPGHSESAGVGACPERERAVDGIAASVVEALANVEAARGRGRARRPVSDRDRHTVRPRRRRVARERALSIRSAVVTTCRCPSAPRGTQPLRPLGRPGTRHADPHAIAAGATAAQRHVDLREAVLGQRAQRRDRARAPERPGPDRRGAERVRPSRHGAFVREPLVTERTRCVGGPDPARTRRGRQEPASATPVPSAATPRAAATGSAREARQSGSADPHAAARA